MHAFRGQARLSDRTASAGRRDDRFEGSQERAGADRRNARMAASVLVVDRGDGAKAGTMGQRNHAAESGSGLRLSRYGADRLPAHQGNSAASDGQRTDLSEFELGRFLQSGNAASD